MRLVILTAAIALAGGSAMASSILPIQSGSANSGGSIVTKSCPNCPPIQIKVAKKSYVVPELKTGTQTIVVRDINGEQKVVRTEAWMGGSPVTFISKASPEALAAAGAPTDGLDPTPTAAVTPAPTAAPAPAPVDVSSFALRLQ
jgi:hypothetical protein